MAQELWIDRQLGRLWKKRGPFPGLGAILSATGVPMGNFVAQALQNMVGDEGNAWNAWDAVLAEPRKHLPAEYARSLDMTIVKSWQQMPLERRQTLELLSRIDLTAEQADVLAIPETRREHGIRVSDADFLRNPYLIYETTRLTEVPVALGTVDRGIFPTTFIRERYPVPAAAAIETAVDGRRLRALTIRELELATVKGDTLCSQETVINALRSREQKDDARRTDVTADLLAVAEEDHFAGDIRRVKMADGSRAYQLERLAQVGELIRSMVSKRAGAERHKLSVNWRAELDEHLGKMPEDSAERDKEEQAREEKAAALVELAESRFSVLMGPAGTGKTTLLSVLCRRKEIHHGGIVLLAPTGKARVRMEDVARRGHTENCQAYTLAQFLSRTTPPRYDPNTQRYLLTEQAGESVARTVIVDECSMLTEEMMAALLEALSGVHRLIFVGDARQLPPIGAGRPFVDIIARLRSQDMETRFPRVGPSYAELTVPRRQGAGERADLQLAAWFGGGVLGPGEDQVFEILAGKRTSDNIRFIRWDSPEELEALLPEILASALGFDPSHEEWQAFACSLGGQKAGEYVYFNRNRSGKSAEAWQMLSPVRQQPWGVDALNRLLHLRYKGPQLEECRANVPSWKRRFPKPFGDAQIVYGDKVINVRNQSVWKKRIYPEPPESGYIANGEIGVAIGQMRTKKFNYDPKHLAGC